MTILSDGYDPTPLAPQIIIYNYAGVEQYRYETSIVSATPTQDFQLAALKLHLGINDDYGYLQLLIHDNNNALTDITQLRPASIARQWSIKLNLGKSIAGLDTWFHGKITNASVIRPKTNIQQISLNCIGWGSILRERLTTIERNQAKQSNGIDLDNTDTSTRIDNLVEDIFTDTDHQVDDGIPQLANITRTQVCSECLNINIANVNEVGNSYAGFISRLATIANVTWTVDPNRDLVMHDPETHDGGLLITNDPLALDGGAWGADKIGIIKSQVKWNDNTANSFYSFLHSYGSFKPKLANSYETTPDAANSMYNTWNAIPFTTTEDTIFKIAIRATRFGTPASGKAEIYIVGDDGSSRGAEGHVNLTGGASGNVSSITINSVELLSGTVNFNSSLSQTAADIADNINANTSTPNYTARADGTKIFIRGVTEGDTENGRAISVTSATITTTTRNMEHGVFGKPNLGDVRRSIALSETKLTALGTTTPAPWWELPIKPKLEVTKGEHLFLVFREYGDATNYYNINYKSGSGEYYDSTDGVTWTKRTGNHSFRVWSARRLKITVENTSLSATLSEPREKLLPVRADLEEQTVREMMLQASTVLAKQVRIYEPIEITPPDKRIKTGYYCRLQDLKTGLDTKAIIESVDLEMIAGDTQSNLGANTIKIGLESIIE